MKIPGMRWVIAAMLFLYALVLAVPGARHFFALTIPGPGETFVALAGAALAVVGLWLTDDRFVPAAYRPRPPS